MNKINYSLDAKTQYINEIHSIPLLSTLEFNTLMNSYKKGDLKAKTSLIIHNLRLVVSIVNEYYKYLEHLDFLDLVQYGNLGLIHAVEGYDKKKGSFSNYATIVIKGYIRNAIAHNEKMIYRPREIDYIALKLKLLLEKYKAKNLPEPTDSMICKELSISPSYLHLVRRTMNEEVISYNQQVGDSELQDFLSIEDIEHTNKTLLSQEENQELLVLLKDILSPLKYYIIYNIILANERKRKFEISKIFYDNTGKLKKIIDSTLREIRPYFMSSNIKYRLKLREILNKDNLNKIRTNPITPDMLLQYHYLKNDLTLLERKLYYYINFYKYKCNKEDYLNLLNITDKEFIILYQRLKSKINNKFKDIQKYNKFKERMLKKYKFKLYDLDLEVENKNINYLQLHNIYGFISLQELQDIIDLAKYKLTPKDLSLLEKFYSNKDQLNGKELHHIYRLFNFLDSHNKKKEEKQFILKNNS